RARWATRSLPPFARPRPPPLPKPRADAPTRFAPASPKMNPGDVSRGAGSRTGEAPATGLVIDNVQYACEARDKANDMALVGLVGWRGMVGSVLMERMQAEGDFALIEPVFFSTSAVGGKAPAMAKNETTLK